MPIESNVAEGRLQTKVGRRADVPDPTAEGTSEEDSKDRVGTQDRQEIEPRAEDRRRGSNVPFADASGEQREPEAAVERLERAGDAASDRSSAAPAEAGMWRDARRAPDRSDVVLEAPQLKVDELSLDLQASLGIEHIQLETKGLEADLFLKANLDNVVALVDSAARRTPDIVATARGEDPPSSSEPSGAVKGLPAELRSAYASARSAYERIADHDVTDEVREAYGSLRDAYERVLGGKGAEGGSSEDGQRDADDGRPADADEAQAGSRGRRLAASAGLATASLAAGALAQSKIPPLARRRRSMPAKVLHELRRPTSVLPRRGGPKLVKAVRRTLD